MLNKYSITKNGKHFEGPHKSAEKTKKHLERLKKESPKDSWDIQVLVDRGSGIKDSS